MDYLFFIRSFFSYGIRCDTESNQPSEILGQSVWNNRFILCKHDPIFYNEFYSKGIRTVSDLMCQDHKFLDWHAKVSWLVLYGELQLVPLTQAEIYVIYKWSVCFLINTLMWNLEVQTNYIQTEHLQQIA